MQKSNINLKKAISILIGLPAALIAVMEIDDLRFVWCRFAALAVVIGILFWNFGKETRNV